MLAYHFPPIGGGGVQRTVKFARYLPEFGYHPVIVSGNGGATTDKLGEDRTLRKDLPSELEIHRISAAEPAPSSVVRARRERWLRIQSPWQRWWIEGALDAARRAGPVDVVFATMTPFESTEVGRTLAEERDVPWVADLRDPWALDEMLVWPTALHRVAERHAMRRRLRSADAIVMNTAEAAAELRRCFPELAERTTVITNGFDAADFAAPVVEHARAAFRIVHAGFLHTAAGKRRTKRLHDALGGSHANVDFLTRSHVFLLEAVERILARRPDLESVLEVHLVGPQSEADRAASARFVRAHGYLPHEQSLELVRSADLLFLPMHNLPLGRRARIVPGKTYEYLASNRPILAAVPDGDARDLLIRAGTAHLTRPDDVAGMATAILNVLETRGAVRAPHVDPRLLVEYERRTLTRKLADLFDGVSR